MSVWVVPNLVVKENEIVKNIEDNDSPTANQIYFLNDLIFLDELKRSLFEIAGGEFDLTFFTKPNDSTYGNQENINLSFSPETVLECVQKIRTAFEKNENNFIRPYQYEGVFDSTGKKVHMVFTVDKVKKGLFSKKIFRWETISTHAGAATLQINGDATDTWIKRIDLTKDNPILFFCRNGFGRQKA